MSLLCLLVSFDYLLIDFFLEVTVCECDEMQNRECRGCLCCNYDVSELIINVTVI